MSKTLKINNQGIVRTAAAYLAVAIMFMGFPLSVFAAPSVDIKANGSDGPVTITEGESWSYSWLANESTACQLTSPSGVSGISLAGNGGPINSDHPWYPAVGSSTTLTIDCTDGTDSSSDSVTINVVADDNGGGGGGGATITADIKANGADGTVTITNGDSWNYSWVSDNATACQLTSPSGVSGISLAGNGGPINSDHPWYPAVGSSTTLTLDCTDGTNTVSDSVTIQITSGGGGGGGGTTVDADIKANGSDGPVTVINGDSWNYSWTSNNATACQLTSPSGVSGISLAGNGGPINSDHPWYPAVGSSTTLTLDCTNGTNTDSDSVTINVVARTTGGGGGGGGGGGSSRPPTNPLPTADVCPWLNSYLRIGANNDMIQVMKLQAFLIHFEGHTNVQVTGIFDQATHEAVKAFQLKYKSDILTPWGISEPTGYVYIRTLAKINQIVCGSPMPAAPAPVKTVPPKIVKDIKKPCPCVCECCDSKEGSKEGSASTTASNIEIIGDSGPDKDIGQRGKNLASALFATPQTKGEFMNTLYGLLLILIVLYVIGSVLENVLYDNKTENVRKRFLSKWITISVGLVAAIIGAYLFGKTTLILPLLIILVLTLTWLFTYTRHNSLRASLKSWNMVISARAKTLLNQAKDEAKASEVTVTENK